MKEIGGEGFCLGSIAKYTDRYGFKNGKQRSDLLKIIHYGILALINHDIIHNEKSFKKDDIAEVYATVKTIGE